MTVAAVVRERPPERATTRTADRSLQRTRPVVAPADDRFEREAESASRAVVDRGEPARVVRAYDGSGRGGRISASASRLIDEAGAEGAPLSAPLRNRYSSGFGHDFSSVRVHAGPRSAEAAATLGAQAFTHGRDVYFGSGYFRPESAAGNRLLAHELVHTIQPRPGVIARQPLTATAPARDETDLAPQAAGTDSTATEVAESLRTDPTDTSGRLRDRLGTLDAGERRAVLAAVRERIGPAERMMLDTVVADAVTTPGAPTRPTAEPGPETRSVGTPPAPSSARPLGERRGREERPSPGTRVRSAIPESSRPQPQAAPTVAAPPTPSEPSVPRPEPPAAPPQAAAPSHRGTEGPTRRAAAATASSRAVGGAATAGNAAAASESAAGEVEADAVGAEESAGPPRLADRLEKMPLAGAPTTPLPEPAGDEEAASAAGAAGPAAASEPGAAEESQPLVDVDALIGEITAATSDTQGTLQGEADAVRSAIRARSGSLVGTVRGHVRRMTAQVHQEFADKRSGLQAALAAAGTAITTGLAGRLGELDTNAQAARERIQGVFTEHRATIAQAVSDGIASTEGVRTRYATLAHDRTLEKARTARQRGMTRAHSYPGTERGAIQADAAQGVADRTASEIEGKEPETVQAIEEVVAGIPDKFLEEGQRTLQGYDEPLPRLLAEVENQIIAARTQLQRAATDAQAHLARVSTELNGELDAAEAAAIARIEALGPRVEAQIAGATRTALRQVDRAVPNAMGHVTPVGEEAAQILGDAESLDPDRSRAFTDAVVGYIRGAADEGGTALNEARDAVDQQFQQADASVQQALGAAHRQATTQLAALESQRNTRLTQFEARVDEEFALPLTTFETGIRDTETRTRERLAPAVAALQGKFRDTLRGAEARCAQALDDGMAKNDEALMDLGSSMSEAASDAAWEYDHPILSAIRDVAEVVAGVIVGILAVVVLVVAVIVAAKLLVIGLIALGVSAATAALVAEIALLVVAVVGIGMIAYAAYQGYEARRARGEGGWEAALGGVSDVIGITDMRRAFGEENLSPFERGFHFGRGAATLVATFFGRRMARGIEARLPPSLANPAATGALLRARIVSLRGGAPPTPAIAPIAPVGAPRLPTAAPPRAPTGAPPVVEPIAAPRAASAAPRAPVAEPVGAAPARAAQPAPVSAPAAAPVVEPVVAPAAPAPRAPVPEPPTGAAAAGPQPAAPRAPAVEPTPARPSRPSQPTAPGVQTPVLEPTPAARTPSAPAAERPLVEPTPGRQAPARPRVSGEPQTPVPSRPSPPGEVPENVRPIGSAQPGRAGGQPSLRTQRPMTTADEFAARLRARQGARAGVEAEAPRSSPQVQQRPVQQAAGAEGYTPRPLEVAPAAGETGGARAGGRSPLEVRASAAETGGGGPRRPVSSASPEGGGPTSAPHGGTSPRSRAGGGGRGSAAEAAEGGGGRGPRGPGGRPRRPVRGATAEGAGEEFRYEYHRPPREPVVERGRASGGAEASAEPRPVREPAPQRGGARPRRGGMELDPETRKTLGGSREAVEEVPHEPGELGGTSERFEGDRFSPAETEGELPSWAWERFRGRSFDPRQAGRTVLAGGRVRPGLGRPRGSTVPDLYIAGTRNRPPISVDAKNYFLGEEANYGQFLEETVAQARQRAGALPRRAQQHLVIDVRGQQVTEGFLEGLQRDLVRLSNGILRPDRIHFLR